MSAANSALPGTTRSQASRTCSAGVRSPKASARPGPRAARLGLRGPQLRLRLGYSIQVEFSLLGAVGLSRSNLALGRALISVGNLGPRWSRGIPGILAFVAYRGRAWSCQEVSGCMEISGYLVVSRCLLEGVLGKPTHIRAPSRLRLAPEERRCYALQPKPESLVDLHGHEGIAFRGEPDRPSRNRRGANASIRDR